MFCFWFVMFVLREMWDLSDAYCTDAHTSWSSHAKHHSEGEQTGFVFTSGVENTSSKLIDEFFLRKSETLWLVSTAYLVHAKILCTPLLA